MLDFNKKFIISLLEKGYKPSSEQDQELLVRKGIISRAAIDAKAN